MRTSTLSGMPRISPWLPLLGILALVPTPAKGGGADDVGVRVRVDGDVVRLEASFSVDASRQEVWSVLTDFEHMTRFISNLKSSSVVARNGDLITVAQAGEASLGLIKFTFESVRELRLTPNEKIHSHMISGNMKRYDGTTELFVLGEGTRVVFRSESVPDKWVPPGVGPYFIERESREQLSEFRAEILRRKLARSADAGTGPGHRE
jgi:carbon monoxide dehydrogenase subunit G